METLRLIIAREFITRVRRRSFILGTILTPLGFVLLAVVAGWIVSHEGNDRLKVAVAAPDTLWQQPTDTSHFLITRAEASVDSLLAQTRRGVYDVVLVVPRLPSDTSQKVTVEVYTDKKLSLVQNERLSKLAADQYRHYKLQALHYDNQKLQLLETKVSLSLLPLDPQGERQNEMKTAVATAVSGFLGFLIYLALIIYGSMVMRSVMEEKTNRVVELMVSTVRPQQLLLGKVIGVGAVGLTQLAIWAILIGLFLVIMPLFMGPQLGTAVVPIGQGITDGVQPASADPLPMRVLAAMSEINWWTLIFFFSVFFLLGYMAYAVLFAAVGSAIGDDMEQSQSLVMPLTVPVIMGFYIMTAAIKNPEGSLALFGSLFPLFSPLVMPARILFDPPWWQVALSVVLLVAFCWLMIWVSGRIYRVGILMYGKTASLRELWRWMRAGD